MAYTFTSEIGLGSLAGYSLVGVLNGSRNNPFTTEPQFLAGNGSVAIVLSSGSVPGLTYSANSWHGTPTAAGTYTVTFALTYTWKHANFCAGQIVIDGANHVQECIASGTTGSSMPTFNDSGGTTTDGTVTWQDQGIATGVPSITVELSVLTTTPSPSMSGNPGLAFAVLNQPFFLPLDGGGSSSTYTFAVVAGSLPPGLALETFPSHPIYFPAIAGTPTASGTYQFSLQMVGNLGDTTTQICTLVVNPVQYSLTPGLLVGPGSAGQGYSFQFSQQYAASAVGSDTPCANYTGPYTFVKEGTWPSWLNLSSAGLISGTPPSAGSLPYYGQVLGIGFVSSTGHTFATSTTFDLNVLAAQTGQAFNGTHTGFFAAGKVGGGVNS